MDITYRRATADDVEALALLRWESELERHPERAGTISWEEYAAAYAEDTRAELEGGRHRAWIADADGEPVACVLLVVMVTPPSLNALRRRRGFVSSVYTRPGCRRLGISRQLMELLLEEAHALRMDRLILWASEMGRPLYEELGFEASWGLELNLPY